MYSGRNGFLMKGITSFIIIKFGKVLLLPFVCVCFLLISYSARTQNRNIQQANQYWIGYISSVAFHKNMSLWNDFHYVPTAFLLVRHGVSYHVTPDIIFTGGFAWLRLGVAGINGLPRKELRPWGQVNTHLKVTDKIILNHRIRYDWRFREDYFVTHDAMYDGLSTYSPVHRIRFMSSVRFPLWGTNIGHQTPFASVNNEVFVNFGKNVTWNYFDQNRLWINIGYQFKKTTFQLGYMMRFVQLSAPGNMALYHTPLLWITQALDVRRRKTEEKSTENLIHREQ